jgi:hypothetical protein
VRIPTVAELEAALVARGYRVVTDPWRVHLIALRRSTVAAHDPLAPPSGTLDAFDDMMCLIRRRPAIQIPELFACRCTTDPGRPIREHPNRRDGTAVWALGQTIDGLKFGTHGTEHYKCFTPAVPIPVLRFTGLDDLVGSPSTSWTTQHHRASAYHETFVVGDYSWGCIVTANPRDYAVEIEWGEEQIANTGHDRFTITAMEWS